MANRQLIAAEEVVEIAFSSSDQIEATSISPTRIENAELKYIAPALGRLYPRLKQGQYPDFVDDFIKEPLAYFVKYGMIPEISVKIGNSGAVKNRDTNSVAASRADLDIIRREAKNMGKTLLNKAVEYLRENADLFPEFDTTDISRKVVICGGIILYRFH